MKGFLYLLVGGLWSLWPGTSLLASSLSFSFYGTPIALSYDPGLVLKDPLRVEAAGLTTAWRSLEQKPYRALLESLQGYRSSLRLNDWLFYKLTQEGVEKMLSGKSAALKELTTAYLLSKSGYDVRITFRHNEVYTNAYVTEELYEIPIIEDKGRQFANLTAARLRSGPLPAMYMLDIPDAVPGRSFSFSLAERPLFAERPVEKVFSFTHGYMVHEIPLRYDAQTVEMLKDYPLTEEMNYISAQSSTALRTSLVLAMNELIAGKSTQESLEILAAATRSGFRYREDNSQFGRSKPMVADELFFYPHSDCEDRTALFFMLVRELLSLPMLVIAYDDHISLAVAAPGLDGDVVSYKGLDYLFCDPTGPSNSSIIGQIPQGYENKPFEIIGIYPNE